EIDKVNKVHGEAAYGLLSALVKNKAGLNPPADLSERLEAAIGICGLQFNSKADERELYQADTGIYLVAMFLGDFIDAYRADHARFGTGVGVKKGKKGEALDVVPLRPWKSDAKRLEAALKQLVANSKTTPIDEKVKKFEPYAQKFLTEISFHRPVLEQYDRPG